MEPFAEEINRRSKLRRKRQNQKAMEKKIELDDQIKYELYVEDMKELYRLKVEREQATINELLTGPRPGETLSSMTSESEVSCSPLSLAVNTTISGTSPNQWSFAKITQMGHFPSLEESTSSVSSSPEISSLSTSLSNGVWGSRSGVSPPHASSWGIQTRSSTPQHKSLSGKRIKTFPKSWNASCIRWNQIHQTN